jgi:hypothetical protein
MKRFLLLTTLAAFVLGAALPAVEAAPAKSKKPSVRAQAASHKKAKRPAKKLQKKRPRKAGKHSRR